MKIDFDRVIDRRGSNSAKWDLAELLFGDKDVIPMWVADMDFPIAEPITEAIRKRTEHPMYGYSIPKPGTTVLAVRDHFKRHYGWEVDPDWIIFMPGVIPSLNLSVRALTTPGDYVLIQGPLYHHFRAAAENNGCQVVENVLQLNNGRYEIDFKSLEADCAPRTSLTMPPAWVRMMFLCNPHNPTGRVWSREELQRIGEIALKNRAVIVSDDIHCDILYPEVTYTPIAAISKEFEQNSITCLSPSKTFNLAGLQASVTIIPNPDLRARFVNASKGLIHGVGIFGLTTLEAAYRHGGEWLKELLAYLRGNLEFLEDFTREKIPQMKVIRPEGTYLIWLDCRDFGLSENELKTLFIQKAKVGLEEGSYFGPNGEGFFRMNIACPRSVLQEALNRIERVVSQI